MSFDKNQTDSLRFAMRPAALLALAFAFAAMASAQSPSRSELDLNAAVDKALASNPVTRVSESRLKIADLRIAESRAARRPSVQFSQSLIGSNNPVFVFGSLLEQGRFSASNFALNSLNNPNPIANLRTLVQAQMPIFDQRQTSARVEQATTAKRMAELQAEGVRQKLRFEVIQSFYGAILGKEMLKVSDEALRSAEANRKRAKDMVEVGMTTGADLLAAEVEVANAEQHKLEAQSGLTTTIAALNLTIGDRLSSMPEINGDLREKFFPIADRDELIRTAFENRPDYLGSELAIRNSRSQTKAVRDLRLPRVDAFGNVGYSSPYIANGSTDFTAGVSLSYTLFDAGRKSREAEAAEAETLAESERAVLANQISLEVVKAFEKYKTARSKIHVSITSIARADEALRIAQDRYRFGLTTMTEVIRAEAAAVAAKQNLLGARYEYYVSYAAVLLATGRLDDVRLFY